MEEAKIRRQPPEKELSRRIALIVGAANGIGREVAIKAAALGAHVMVADRDHEAATRVATELKSVTSAEFVSSTAVDITSREAVAQAIRATVAAFGGLDIVINTAALFATPTDGVVPDRMWAPTLELNVTANYLLANEAAKIFDEQTLDASVVLTSSANAVVPKRGSNAYDVSKAALSHLVRELAVALAPRVRVNGISPATVVKGSTMFPRERLRASLDQYDIPFQESDSDEDLRNLLAAFYAERTLTRQPIDPADCAEAILFLASPRTRMHHRPHLPGRRRPSRGLPPLKRQSTPLRHNREFNRPKAIGPTASGSVPHPFHALCEMGGIPQIPALPPSPLTGD